jgi:arylsulfatase A-like enzyme
MWEGGIRVPCIVRWPGGNVPAGTVNDEFLTSLELFPSLAAATGALMRDDVELDGFDWWPVIRGEQSSPREEMFWQRKDQIGARVGKWKWVDMGAGVGGLFDLSQDVAETHDLSRERPEVLKMVKSRYAQWREAMDASDPRGPFRDF